LHALGNSDSTYCIIDIQMFRIIVADAEEAINLAEDSNDLLFNAAP
jgi:hypothetical protein